MNTTNSDVNILFPNLYKLSFTLSGSIANYLIKLDYFWTGNLNVIVLVILYRM